MKNVLLMIALSLGVSGAFAQKLKETEVPSAVKEGFKKHFPNTAVNGWEKENGNYEAGFVLNKAETSALLDASGKLLETESEISVSELPKAVSDYLAKNESGKK